ncbi:hypothetical protein [Pacificispira sp.]|uniref:hypothetical protein n=1 Tax=Pacificispira sp. TaxID=2888761 RepID=UPI003B519027
MFDIVGKLLGRKKPEPVKPDPAMAAFARSKRVKQERLEDLKPKIALILNREPLDVIGRVVLFEIVPPLEEGLESGRIDAVSLAAKEILIRQCGSAGFVRRVGWTDFFMRFGTLFAQDGRLACEVALQDLRAALDALGCEDWSVHLSAALPGSGKSARFVLLQDMEALRSVLAPLLARATPDRVPEHRDDDTGIEGETALPAAWREIAAFGEWQDGRTQTDSQPPAVEKAPPAAVPRVRPKSPPQVTAADKVAAVETAIRHDLKRVEAGFDGIWDLSHKTLSGVLAVPMKRGPEGGISSGFDLFGRGIPPEILADLDLKLLAEVEAAAGALPTDQACRILVPIHYGVLAASHFRDPVVQSFRALGERLTGRASLIASIVSLPRDFSARRLADLAGMLKSGSNKPWLLLDSPSVRLTELPRNLFAGIGFDSDLLRNEVLDPSAFVEFAETVRAHAARPWARTTLDKVLLQSLPAFGIETLSVPQATGLETCLQQGREGMRALPVRDS